MIYKILALLFLVNSSYAFGARQLHADTIKKTDASVLTLPSATDTLVGKATTDTLTNKSISGSTNTITNVSLTTGVTGTLPVANGGTGTASLTANNVVLGNGASAVQFVAPGTSGNVLTSNGTTWTSAASAASGMASASGATDRTVRATMVCSGSSSITHQGGSWVSSIGNISSGACTVTISGSTFSSANYSCATSTVLGGDLIVVGINTKTTTSFIADSRYYSGGTAIPGSFTFDVICTGPQ